MPGINDMMERQRVLASFGDFAIRSNNLQDVLDESCRLIASALHTEFAKVLEIQHGRDTVLVRAGHGWPPGIVGHTAIKLDENWSGAYALDLGIPVVCRDFDDEDRFTLPEFMRDAGVRALVNVPIFVPGRQIYGLLEVDARSPRDFSHEATEFLRTYATILGPVIDRLHKVEEIERQSERLNLIVQNALDYAIFIIDGAGKVTDWLPGAEAIFGWTAEEIVGRDAALLADAAASWPQDEMAVARRDGYAPDTRWHTRKGGEKVFLDGRLVPLRKGDGENGGFLKIGRDITDMRRATEALRESEHRFRQFGEASANVLWIRAARTMHMEYVNPAFATVYGLPLEAVAGDGDFSSWIRLILPEDREAVVAAFDRILEGERVIQEFRIRRRSDNAVRWIRDTSFPLFGAEGEVERLGGIAEDVTEAKAMSDRMGVLVAELQHRTRNLLAVVYAISRRTIAGSRTLEQFSELFGERLSALSRVNGLLSRLGNEHDRVTFDELLLAELEALGAVDDGKPMPKVTLDGPPGVKLRSSTVQTFALALHELATNAAKHGALAQPAGHLTVHWAVQDGAGASRLYVEWLESGVALSGEVPPPGSGYGRELIERALPHQLGAKTSFTLSPDGVRCTILMRISAAGPRPAMVS